MADSCEPGNELSDSEKCGEFLYQLGEDQLMYVFVMHRYF
jgi:hypothetical protein